MTTVGNAVNRLDRTTTSRARVVTVRAFRPRRSWTMLVVAALVLAVAGCAAMEVISALAGSAVRVLPWGAVGESGATRWRDPTVLGASAVLAAIGLMLTLLALLPGRGTWTALRTEDPARAAGVARPVLCRALAAAARGVEGVSRARVWVRCRHVWVSVRVDDGAVPGAGEKVGAAVERRLAELVPLAPLCEFTVSTRVRRRRTRRW